MAGPDPDKRLHANRPFSIPWTSDHGKGVYSRRDILAGKQKAAWGSDQSMGIASDGQDLHNIITHPQKWPNQGRVLKVPKCVILSSFPQWTLFWPSCYFYGPRDVIGQMFTPPKLFGNYYYFDQWNDMDPDQAIHDETLYCNSEVNDDCGDLPSNETISSDSPFWDNFDPPVPDGDKHLWTRSYQNSISGAPPDQTDGIVDATLPPKTRYNQIVGKVTQNPYYQLQAQLAETFKAVQKTLESDPVDPIYVTIPNWLDTIYQTRNGYLTKPSEKFNPAHGSGCSIVDVVPCYTPFTMPWGPAYPDGKDSRNAMDFPGPTVPYLASTDPGFGTNTLHIYVGHANHSYSTGASIFDYQAFPLTPEVQFLGPIEITNYTGAALPFFSGRRGVWRDYGFDFGFMNHGAKGVYNTYAGLIGGAADKYKQNFYKHRMFGTRLFTYPQSIVPEWNFLDIWKDQKSDCHSTQFYFGFTFAEFVEMFSSEDQWFNDCSGSAEAGPTHLKIAESIGNFPDSPSIRTAINTFYPPIRKRVEAYYSGIEPGTEEFYKLVIENQGLADYNVQYGGSFASLLDADALVSYIRQYFKDFP